MQILSYPAEQPEQTDSTLPLTQKDSKMSSSVAIGAKTAAGSGKTDKVDYMLVLLQAISVQHYKIVQKKLCLRYNAFYENFHSKLISTSVSVRLTGCTRNTG